MDQHPTGIGRALSGSYRIDALLRQGGMHVHFFFNTVPDRQAG